jgi:serine/threonine protein kinase
MSTLEQVHRFTFRDPFHRGPLVAMSRGKWERFGLPVYERSFESVHTLKLITSDLRRYLDTLIETAPRARGRHLPDVIELVQEETVGARIIMRLPTGELLQETLKSHRSLPIDDVLSIVRGVADALLVCRATGTTHRGPTPDRIWLGREGEVMLLGHGEVLYSEVTLSLRVMVAPQLVWHLPPEVFEQSQGAEAGGSSVSRRARLRTQSNREPEDDPRAEVYALACLVYQCLKGHHPFFLDPKTTRCGTC